MRPKKSAIHEGVRALHRLAQKAMDAPEDTPQQRRQKARALSELLVPMMRVHQARTGSLFDDLDYYPPYVHAGYGAGEDVMRELMSLPVLPLSPAKNALSPARPLEASPSTLRLQEQWRERAAVAERADATKEAGEVLTEIIKAAAKRGWVTDSMRTWAKAATQADNRKQAIEMKEEMNRRGAILAKRWGDLGKEATQADNQKQAATMKEKGARKQRARDRLGKIAQTALLNRRKVNIRTALEEANAPEWMPEYIKAVNDIAFHSVVTPSKGVSPGQASQQTSEKRNKVYDAVRFARTHAEKLEIDDPLRPILDNRVRHVINQLPPKAKKDLYKSAPDDLKHLFVETTMKTPFTTNPVFNEGESTPAPGSMRTNSCTRMI
eukprot:jgi/Mesvir1/28553/Mv17824-RA.1